MMIIVYIVGGILIGVLITFAALKLAEKRINRAIDHAFDGFEHFDNLKG